MCDAVAHSFFARATAAGNRQHRVVGTRCTEGGWGQISPPPPHHTYPMDLAEMHYKLVHGDSPASTGVYMGKHPSVYYCLFV